MYATNGDPRRQLECQIAELRTTLAALEDRLASLDSQHPDASASDQEAPNTPVVMKTSPSVLLAIAAG